VVFADDAGAAVFVQHAGTAHGAFLRPNASFFENAKKSRIEAGINGFASVTLD
jgi:hypothetical protein